MSQSRLQWGMGPAVKYLIMFNVLVLVFDITNCNKHLLGIDMHQLFGLHYWETTEFKPFQFISYMFLHDRASFLHIFFNMFNLWMFGNLMERRWGTQRFLLFYFVCGIGGALLQQAAWSTMFVGKSTADLCLPAFGYDITNGGTLTTFNINNQIYAIDELRNLLMNYEAPICIGASGATFGVMVAFAMTFPNIEMFLMFIPIPIKAKYLIGAFVVLEIVETFTRTNDGICHLGHLGGIIFGVLLILLWRKTGEDNGPVF